MTIPDKIKWIADYFNLQLSEFDKKKLEKVLISDEKIIVKEVPVITYRSFDENKQPVDLIAELQKICKMYHVSLNDLLCPYGKGGPAKISGARVYFCRHVKTIDKNITSVQLGDILKKDHTTILYYWYNSKADCEIPPLQKNRN